MFLDTMVLCITSTKWTFLKVYKQQLFAANRFPRFLALKKCLFLIIVLLKKKNLSKNCNLFCHPYLVLFLSPSCFWAFLCPLNFPFMSFPISCPFISTTCPYLLLFLSFPFLYQFLSSLLLSLPST